MNEVARIPLTTFSIMLGKKHGIGNQYLGLMKSWVVNVGAGSFREGKFEEGESVKLNFGFQ